MMRGFVEAHAAKFLVGLQLREPQIESFLQTSRLLQLLQSAEIADVPRDARRAK